MQFADRIRIGARMKEQGFRYIHRNGKTCAFGAAMDADGVLNEWLEEQAVTGGIGGTVFKEWSGQYPELTARTSCAHCADWVLGSVEMYIIHLNDDHRLTREQIADEVQRIADRQAHRELVTA